MERRSFLRLLGLAVVGTAVGEAIPQEAAPVERHPQAVMAEKLLKAPVRLGFKRPEFLSPGYIWAPCVPIDTMTFHRDGTITHEWHGQHAHRNKKFA